MSSKEWYKEIHTRLLAGDPTAPAELVENTIDVFVLKLRKRYPQVSDPFVVEDAVTDALIDYLKEPSRFDPNQLDLPGFLRMAADRNVKNSLAKLSRRKRRESRLGDVEQSLPDGNRNVEEAVHGHLQGERIPDAAIRFLDKRELGVFDLMIEGVRETGEYASVLGIQDQPLHQQRLEVKRCKDRIKKRLQRHGEVIFHDEHEI